MDKIYKFHRTGYSAHQLLWDIEDNVGVRVGRHSEQESVSGALNTSGNEITVVVYGPEQSPTTPPYVQGKVLSAEEEEQLELAIMQHTPRAPNYQGELSDAVTRYADSVGRVLVREKSTGDEKYASGFLYERRDCLLTAAHVIEPEKFDLAGIEFSNSLVEAKIIKVDLLHDIALLKLHRPVSASPFRIRYPFVAPGSLGKHCVVIGYPSIPGMEHSPSFYEVSLVSKKRNYIMQQDLIELSTHLGSGCSGAPVLTIDHSLIGMIVGFPDDGTGETGRRVIWPKWTPVAVPSNELAAWNQFL